jgi:hypothetical protein
MKTFEIWLLLVGMAPEPPLPITQYQVPKKLPQPLYLTLCEVTEEALKLLLKHPAYKNIGP